jgi:hypothetical protein
MLIAQLDSQQQTSLDSRSNEILEKVEIQEISKGGYLNTEHINAAIALLRTEFPEIGGLFNVQWGQNLSFPGIEKDQWIQIIHTSQNHWIAAAFGYGKSTNVLIYDSLNSQCIPTTHTIYCVAQLRHSPDNSLKISLMPCENQEDGVNCGTFAIAFATALAFKLNPSELRFDQTIMRQHLINCLLNGKMEAFPVISTRKNSNWRPRKQLSIDLNCICKIPFSEKDCGMPEKYRKVVQCLSCKIWYHPECESIPDTVVGDKNSLWFCSQCRARKRKRNSK